MAGTFIFSTESKEMLKTKMGNDVYFITHCIKITRTYIYAKGTFTTFAFTALLRISINISLSMAACSIVT